ncbi:MAG TPA: hemerythrin domain-containing protein [Nitrospiria bacterium]|nr:hemerythrin domain-containing protein [Nitrospiria bacterium]
MGMATEQLKREHEAIETMLKVLDAVCGRIKAGKTVDPAHLVQIVDFFRGFADRCHHGKEEEIFFPALEMAGIPREGGPIGVMLGEHDRMRGLMHGLAEVVDRYRAGEGQAGQGVVLYASDYAATLRRHIEKENQVLFKMAEMHLSPEEERELAERFEAMEVEKIGAGTHEKLNALLDRLEGIYLP